MRKIFFRLAAIALLCLRALPCGALPDYSFTVIDTDRGLSHNTIKAVLQDSRGFMWVGTRNRLNRYDGVTLRTFDCADTVSGRSDNNISAIFEAADGQLWLGTDKGVYIFNPVRETFTFFAVSTPDGIRITDWIADIQASPDGNLWVVAPNQGVFRYETSSGRLTHYTVVERLSPDESNPQCIAIEKNGRVWVGSHRSGVYLWDKTNDCFLRYVGDADRGATLEGEGIFSMCHQGEYLILGIHNGKVLKFDKRRNAVVPLDIPAQDYGVVRAVTLLDGNLWVGTSFGLYIIDEERHHVQHVREEPLDPQSLSDNVVTRIYRDREGGTWIGTGSGGVNYLPPRNNSFERYIPLNASGRLISKRVREMRENAGGQILVGTEDAGVSIFDPATGSFRMLQGLTSRNALALHLFPDRGLVGFFKNGLDVTDASGRRLHHYDAAQLGLNEGSVYALCEDRRGGLWLGNGWGVFHAPASEMHFSRMERFGTGYIFDIVEDSDGEIWVATMGQGILRYDPQKDSLSHYLAGTGTGLSSNSVSSITEDHIGQLWFSTDRGGICRFNKQEGRFRSYSTAEGLPDEVAYKIVEDREHRLWFGTNKGLVRFNPADGAVKVFTRDDGLLSNQFNYKSACAMRSGKLYFGSTEGIVGLQPEEFRTNEFVPPVYITRLSVFNREMVPCTENTVLDSSIVYASRVVLDHRQSNIGFDFVALSYAAPAANRYVYRMEGIDADWIATRGTRSATYAKLTPGRYLFRVRGSNNDGVWNSREATLEIIITPPWWASRAAILAYILLAVAAFYLSLAAVLRWHRKRSAARHRLFEIEKERELYEAKVDFFTDIAHEIRTPLTLISGPLEAVMEMRLPGEELSHNLSLIRQNTDNLLGLINQLLDFRKVDSRRMPLTFRRTDAGAFVRKAVERFGPQAASQGKRIGLELQSVTVDVDRDSLSKIVDNLLSNALKYSDSHIVVRLWAEGSEMIIRVENDGSTIPEQLRERIFEPFVQLHTPHNSSPGSGIGLALARSLAELHGGTLLCCEEESMNVFTLALPLRQDKVVEESPMPEEESAIATETGIREAQSEFFAPPSGALTVLVVEDNPSMLDFVARCLRGSYRVETATDGVTALDILHRHSIDLVVSDVMMSGMDGFELCRRIKSDLTLGHILVVLLTARTDEPSKIRGLELGADAYIEKPFSTPYLLSTLSALTENRRRNAETFLKKPFLQLRQGSMSKADEEFMDQVVEAINERITDPDFNVETLAERLCMSRSSLHRRIRATLATTPTDFIRLVRLQRAANLIHEGRFRINEIGYLVGINSPSYFAKLFQAQYGVTPREFEKQHSRKGIHS